MLESIKKHQHNQQGKEIRPCCIIKSIEKHVFSVYKTPSQVINVMLCYVISTLPTNAHSIAQ